MNEEQRQQILRLAASSPCATHDWKNRGRAPVGYIKGMALTYAKCFLESREPIETAVSVMKRALRASRNDALAWYQEGAKIPASDLVTETDRLRALFTLGTGLGMRESSGNTTEGRDTTVHNPTAANAEAGLFQTSFDSFNGSPFFPILFEQYRSNAGQCLRDIFREGARDLRRPIVGTGPGADFQRFTKECPACATEYATVMLRIDRRHFGPINRREAEYLRSCNDMFRAVETVLETP